MEQLQTKLSLLLSVWSDYMPTDDSTASTPATWQESKLESLSAEVEHLLTRARKDRAIFSATLDDLCMEIEQLACSLGHNPDLFVNCTLLQVSPKTALLALRQVRGELIAKVRCNDLAIQEYSAKIRRLKNYIGELPESLLLVDKDVERKLEMGRLSPNDLSASTVYAVTAQFCRIKAFVETQMTRLKTLATEVVTLEGELDYGTITPLVPSSTASLELTFKTDEALCSVQDVHVFSTALASFFKSLPDAEFSTEDVFIPSLPPPLSLSTQFLNSLESHLNSLREERAKRRTQWALLCREVKRLWEELSVAEDQHSIHVHDILRRSGSDRFPLKREDLKILETERDRLFVLLRERLQELVDTYKAELAVLWLECFISDDHQNDFMRKCADLDGNLESMHILLRDEVDYLRPLHAKCKMLFKLMRERTELIQAMKDFEISASDPKRLFRSSFQLVAEERWRKTCYPNLLKLEAQLMTGVQAFEEEESKFFIHNGKRYLEVLQSEVQDRFVSKTFFDFNANSTSKAGSTSSSRLSLNTRSSQEPTKGPVSPSPSERSGRSRSTSRSRPSSPSIQRTLPIPHRRRPSPSPGRLIPKPPNDTAQMGADGKENIVIPIQPLETPQKRGISPGGILSKGNVRSATNLRCSTSVANVCIRSSDSVAFTNRQPGFAGTTSPVPTSAPPPSSQPMRPTSSPASSTSRATQQRTGHIGRWRITADNMPPIPPRSPSSPKSVLIPSSMNVNTKPAVVDAFDVQRNETAKS